MNAVFFTCSRSRVILHCSVYLGGTATILHCSPGSRFKNSLHASFARLMFFFFFSSYDTARNSLCILWPLGSKQKNYFFQKTSKIRHNNVFKVAYYTIGSQNSLKCLICFKAFKNCAISESKQQSHPRRENPFNATLKSRGSSPSYNPAGRGREKRDGTDLAGSLRG